MRKTGKFTNLWRLNSMLLNSQWVKAEIYLETNENGNKTYLNLQAATKAVLRGTNAYIKKKERFQINNLTLHLKELEKEKTKPRVSRTEENNNQNGNKGPRD